MDLETIEIVNPDGAGPMIINQNDYDPAIHTLWTQRRDAGDSPPDERSAELEQLYQEQGWRAIADIAEPLGIEKPDGGWRDAIPLIVERERAT